MTQQLNSQIFAYAKQLADSPADQQLVAIGKAPISFLDYDWNLNGTN